MYILPVRDLLYDSFSLPSATPHFTKRLWCPLVKTSPRSSLAAVFITDVG